MPNYLCTTNLHCHLYVLLWICVVNYAFFYISWKIQCSEYGLVSQFWAYKSFWSAIGQSMVVKNEHFLQQKCSWNVTDVLKHRSINRNSEFNAVQVSNSKIFKKLSLAHSMSKWWVQAPNTRPVEMNSTMHISKFGYRTTSAIAFIAE